MKSTFDFKRFGKYYVSDLRGVFNDNWLTVLLTALGGVIAYLFCGTIQLIADGAWGSYGVLGRSVTFLVLFAVLYIIMPAKEYGYITEKRRGSFFLLLPASPFEKSLSMILNVAILTPLAFLAIAFAADALLCLVDPGCGSTLASVIFSGTKLSDAYNCVTDCCDILNQGDLIWGGVMSVITTALIFLVGALYFKKSKVAKTFLVLIGLTLVFIIFTCIAVSVGDDCLCDVEEDPELFLSHVKTVGYVLNVVIILALCAWTYLRVKTIKH